MNKKHAHTGIYYILGPNLGVWVLILVHLLILFGLVYCFSSVIEHMSNY